MENKNKWFGKTIHRYKFVPTRAGYGRYECVTTERTYDEIKSIYLGMFPGVNCTIKVYCNGELLESFNLSPYRREKMIFDTDLRVTYRSIQEMAENMQWTRYKCKEVLAKSFRFKLMDDID